MADPSTFNDPECRIVPMLGTAAVGKERLGNIPWINEVARGRHWEWAGSMEGSMHRMDETGIGCAG